ncbi:hypothetical protein CMV_021445 [Castanea mollissima]|uniref:TIR domain-containing protein n=1 Tax=Castanea mollissima TaxID=60419 RepID=A0A8J4V970_9ROSI|nr:hypothetical protein CMV_021445 [Castanea mollissima]
MPILDPSDVRKQTGPFEKAFDEHQKNDRIDREKIQKWKDAMREVGNLFGEHLLPHQRSEAKCIKVIVKEILNKLILVPWTCYSLLYQNG